MRGTPATSSAACSTIRIIPAYAGNTPSRRCPKRRSRDHPRVCGEHLINGITGMVGSGSSPRMRGTHPCRAARSSRVGIIPAYAGNTANDAGDRIDVQDHPRVCGEHFSKSVRTVVYVGSSPRMRGTLEGVGGAVLELGIIPAYAGNTIHQYVSERDGRDHPRVCGEHMNVASIPPDFLGSSPRMRGTHLLGHFQFLGDGIIPAYAGNTVYMTNPDILDPGSSPRMRGTH